MPSGRRNPSLLIISGSLTGLLLLLVGLLVSVSLSKPAQADENCQLARETGFNICGRFLEYWNGHGGLAQQGYPISEVFEERNAPPPAGDGLIHRVQYFERARFEEHLEQPANNQVLLGLLGTEQYGTKYGASGPPPAQSASSTSCQTFPLTGFAACGQFLDYWNAHGGLAQQGYPISKIFEERNAPPPAGDGLIHRVQYFERARFEEHLDKPAEFQVLLGLLGTEQYRAKYATGSPAPAPTTGQPVVTPGRQSPAPPVSLPPGATPLDPTPVATPPPGAPVPAAGCLPAYTGDSAVQVCLDDINPPADPAATDTLHARVIVQGLVGAGATLKSAWHFRTKTGECSAVADSAGVASCTLNLDGVESRYEVFVDVTLTYQGQNYYGSASFIPR